MHTPDERSAWLEERRKGIGASDVGILFGVSPYGSLLSLYADKIGTVVEDAGDALVRRVGQEFERFVLTLLAEETGLTIEPNSESIAHPDCHARATPDAFAFRESDSTPDIGDVDAKVVGQHNVGTWLDGNIPLDYEIQLQTQMLVTGHRWAIIAGLLLGTSKGFVWHRVEADPTLQAIIRQRIEWFWTEHVEPRRPPDADSHPATARAIAALHPDDNGMLIQLGAPLQYVKQELVRAEGEAKALKRVIALRKNQLRLALADATFGEFPDGTGVGLKSQKTGHGGRTRVLRTMKPRAVSAAKKQCEERLEDLLRGVQ